MRRGPWPLGHVLAMGLVAATIAPSFLARAQPLPGAALQSALDSVIGGPDAAFQGAVVAVSRPGQAAWAGAAGVQDLDGRAHLTPDAGFRAGSIAKPFVATVVLQLVEEGAFGLDDPVSALLPSAVTDRFDGAQGVTVRMLLNHTSGIPEWIDDEVVGRIAANPDKVWTASEFLDLAAAKPRTFGPGAGWSYSNTNYNLLGLIVERVTGRTWRDEVRARVLEPLALTHTHLPEPGDLAMPVDAMHGYGVMDGNVVDLSAIDPSMAGAAGGGALVTTAADLVTFLDALLSGSLFHDPGTLAEMATFVDAEDEGGQSGYGLGLQRFLLPGGLTAVGHQGRTAGYFSFVLHVPALDATLALAVDAWQVDPTPVVVAALAPLMPAPAGAPGQVSDEPRTAFEADFAESMPAFNVPGAVVAVVQDGGIVYAKGFGVRDLETGAPGTTGAIFRTGSITKAMTSMMIASLVEDSLSRWDARAVGVDRAFELPTEELARTGTPSPSVSRMRSVSLGTDS